MENKVNHFMKYCFFFFVLKYPNNVSGQQYNLTGSSSFAVLGEAFTWTCDCFLPPGDKTEGYWFYRNNDSLATVGYVGNSCTVQIKNANFTYGCVSKSIYTLTIPAEKMTESEQGSTWACSHVFQRTYRSSDKILTIAINVNNVTLIPSVNPLTIREGTQRELRCVVNSNAVPAPIITWYLGTTDITNRAGTDTTSINITGNRTDNKKTLQCRATNNSKPPKVKITTLNVEYSPTVNALSQQDIREGRDLSVTCMVTPGNPNLTTIYWTKVDSGLRQNGPTLYLPNIMRTSSGTYRCTANNNYSNGEIGGPHSQSMVVDVLYSPTVNALSQQNIREGSDLSVTCVVTPGNPNLTTIYWTKVDSGLRQNGPTLYLPNIMRTSSGTYRCTAENNYINGEIGTHSQSMVVDVLYSPTVSALSQQNIREGSDLSVTCEVAPGNPNLTTIYWTKVDSGIRQNGPTLYLPNIMRTSSGTYSCTATNNYSNGEIGTHSQSMVVDVLYSPTIEILEKQYVNESEKVTLIGNVTSNPLANVSWFSGTKMVKNQTSVTTTSFTVENATCTDTKNYTVRASNGIRNASEVLVELFVNCKPRSNDKNISLGVTDTTGIEFSSIIIAYPKPQYELQYENGSKNNQMMHCVTMNAVYNYTIRYNQTVVNQGDYGTFHLIVNNSYGETTVYVNVIAQRKPDMPTISDFLCEIKTARIQWESSFNGGDPQSFTVVSLHGNQIENKTDTISDQGTNTIHTAFVQNLQSSTTYVLAVAAHNKHGFSLSKNISCTTLEEEGVNLPLVAGGAVAVGITLAVIVIVIVLMFRRYKKNEEQAGKPQRLEDELGENRDIDDDGLKENILYVSADTRDIDKPESAVYAAVNKRSQESNNNANVYAEVNKSEPKIREGAFYSDVKPKKGFFKKNEPDKVGGKPKQRKGKKQKTKQETADVYENSEDIAMTPNVDNVYSNSEHKNQSETKQRGYKNKDGLLYVEVNFDGKHGQDNPVIHGEDEKTDYATVEFPMPSALNKAAGSEEL